jgi:ribosomal-protein-alanine N-acetyltransferase
MGKSPRNLQVFTGDRGWNIINAWIDAPVLRNQGIPTRSQVPPCMIQNYSILPMTLADVEKIASVERLCHIIPWTAEVFATELANPLSRTDILWRGQEPAGYLCSWLIADELHVLNLATAPRFRRQGVAGILLRHVVDRSRGAGMKEAILEVRVHNVGAIALYKHFGFQELYLRSGYYPDGEDALVMVFRDADNV